ncbi:MAG: ABC transporter permease subunit [Eubacterium sp.]|nr:ABC transporter permease subunit [Eubacterium sp.]
MINVIRADIGRVFRKRSFYIIVLLVLVFLATRESQDTAPEQMEYMKSYLSSFLLFGVSIPVFLGIYTDDFNSGSVINLIGKGMSRKKVIFAKLLDVAAVLIAFYSVAYVIILIKNMAAGISVTPNQNLSLLVFTLFCVLRGIGFFAVASLVVFSTWSTSGGMTTLLVLLASSKTILRILQLKFTKPIYDRSFDGLLDSAFARFDAGHFGWNIIPAIVIYIGGTVLLSMILFKKKELDL